MESIVTSLFSILGIYLLLGAIFSIFFLWKGIGKVDAGTNGSGLVFKLMLFPAMTVFWVIFLRKWLKAN